MLIEPRSSSVQGRTGFASGFPGDKERKLSHRFPADRKTSRYPL